MEKKKIIEQADKHWKEYIKVWDESNGTDNYTLSLVPKKEFRKNLIFSPDWQTNEICKRYCDIEDILKKHKVKNSKDLNERLEKAEMFDYLMKFVKNVDFVESFHYLSFINDTPWLNCIKIDKKHHDKLKKLGVPIKENVRYVVEFINPLIKTDRTYLRSREDKEFKDVHICSITSLNNATKYDTWKEARKAAAYLDNLKYGVDIIVRKIKS